MLVLATLVYSEGTLKNSITHSSSALVAYISWRKALVLSKHESRKLMVSSHKQEDSRVIKRGLEDHRHYLFLA